MPYRRVEWNKVGLDDGAYESAGAFDVNNDGVMDIVCGGNWYEGPKFAKHRICDVRKDDEYFDDFSTIPMDVNGDGYLDIITGGYFGATLQWRENPEGKPVEWKTHVIDDKCGAIETTRAWDVDGDGELEIVPNTPPAPLVFYKLLKDGKGKGTGEFRKYRVSNEASGHGLGFGDVTGSGRGSLVVRNGFWEAPAEPLHGQWRFYPEFELGVASVPILVADLDGCGRAEIIYGQAHGYGLDYLKRDGKGKWIKHPIDPYFSQYHDMQWVDIDGDGQCELVTGNRYRAHCGREPGETEVAGLYFFKWNGESFSKQVIDHGPVPGASGTGIHFAVADLNGNGRLDIVAPGKEGLFIFYNLGPESAGT